jgi:hypothetical protein
VCPHACGESMLTHFDGNKTQKHTEIKNKNGKIYSKLLVDTENDKHNNPEIIRIKNIQGNNEKHQSHESDVGMENY